MTNFAAADLELAAQVASAFLRRPVQAIAPVCGKGSVKLIYTARAGDTTVVVRMSKPEDAERGLLFYKKEAWCLAQAAAVGIPGPQVLEIGRWRGRPYMLQSLVAGVNGEDSGQDEAHIWRVLGSTMTWPFATRWWMKLARSACSTGVPPKRIMQYD